MAGTIGVYGVIADESITIQKSRGPYNFNICVHQWPTRSREAAAQKPLCEWIRAGKLKASEFVTHQFPVESINDALAMVKSGNALKVLLRY
jgi:threonine dehydrogenase-like Zn-dependent dehydrogenase